jgi:hypothetical protein
MEGVEHTSTCRAEPTDSGSDSEQSVQMLCSGVDQAGQLGPVIDIERSLRTDWIGTSPFFTEHNIKLQGAVSYS